MELNLNKSTFFNPSIFFAYLWIFVYFLFLLKLHPYIRDPHFYSSIYLFIIIVIIYLTRSRLDYNEKIHLLKSEDNTRQNILVSRVLWGLFLFETVREALFFGSIPLLSAFGFGGIVGYNDGIKEFSVANIFFIRSVIIYFSGFYLIRFIMFRKQKYLIFYIVTIFLSIINLSRSILISVLITSVITTLYFVKINWKQMLFGLLMLLLLFFAFDKMFFMRNQADDYFIKNQYVERTFLSSVKEGSLEFYRYLTGPINNALYNIDESDYGDFNFKPEYSLGSFIPNRVYQLVFNERRDVDKTTKLVKGFNTYTFIPKFLFSFGLIGNIFLILIIGMVLRYIYDRFKFNPHKWLFAIVLILHTIAMSIFSSSITNPVYIFPIIVAYFFPPIIAKPKKFE
jgi:oligosaccharide repeat unit polymerase